MTHRWIAIAAVTLVPSVGRAQQAPPAATATAPVPRVEVTLEDAIRRALEVQPAIVSARGTQRNMDASKRQALGAFLPSLSTSWAAQRRWDSDQQRIDPSTGQTVVPLYNHTLGLSVQLELFDGLRRFNSLRAAGAQQGAADAAFTTQRYAVMLDTKRFFYTALANEALVTVQEAQVRRAQQQLQISIEKLRAGSATRSDSLRSTVDYGNARIQLLQARANLATAQANLGRQIGVDELVRAAGDTGLPAFPDTASLRAGAIAHAPAVQQSDAELRAARAQVMATRSQYLPSVTVSYNDNRQGVGWPQFTGFDNYAENYTWRFGLQWTLFNGFSRETQQVSASVTRDVAEARAADARLSVSAQLTQQLALVSTTFEQIAIADANRAAATEDLRVQQERYRVGAATILDLLTSQAALTQAEVNTVQTRFNYLIARAQVEAIVGRAL